VISELSVQNCMFGRNNNNSYRTS